MTDAEEALKEIDRAHLTAKVALDAKDFAGYLDVFSDSLRYTQPDGRTINKKSLSADIRKYFSRLKDVSSNFSRIDYSIEGDTVVERVVQTATLGIRVFLVFTKRWKLEREGNYKWRKEDGIWRIFNVEVSRETVR